MIRRYGPPPDTVQRYKLRPGAYAILPRGNELLLTHQDAPEPEFQLPGGGVDPGEHPLTALHREVFEETGWRISSPRRLGAFRRFTYMPEYELWAEKLCVIYVARPVRPLGPPSDAGHQAVWMAPELAARHLGNSGDRDFVTQHFLR
ncbi:NUDIX hydrolase [Primorskyibacter sp. 2E233]|uniref:NUDIX hydrolase n=1 Tax=Primorskyibacter sp. 2E233 TaxID=3413431 RepID=UPI003BF347C1